MRQIVLKSFSTIAIFLGLLLIRFFVSTLFFNADFYNHLAWVTYLKQFGTENFYNNDFTPWAKANYPPLANYLFLFFDNIAHTVFNNPSQEIISSFYKLVSIIPETALATYFLVTKKKLLSLIILLNPGIFYNTLFWGQTEGAISSLTAFSALSFISGYTLFGFMLFATSLLIKQSAIVFLPIIAVIVYKLVLFKKITLAFTLTFIYIWFAFIPFISSFLDPIKFYLTESGGQAHQQFSSVNAFNFWFLIGLNNQPDSLRFLYLNLQTWGYLIIGIIILFVLKKIFRTKQLTQANIFTALGLTIFATFLFSTRMHERHFFPVLIFLLPFATSSKRNFCLYLFLSLYHFLNLYWVWGYPQLPLSIFLSENVINFMILGSILSFGYIMFNYLKKEKI